jgi:peptidoglycan/LPS O-acetylase OafA/YrhL
MMDLVNLIIRPSRLFKRLKDHPSWVMSFVALAIVSAVLEWFSFGTALRTAVDGLPERATPEMLQDATAYLEGRRFINLLLSPLKLWAIIAIFSYVIYLVCSVSKSVSLPHWKHFFAAVVWSYWILIVGEALSLVTHSVVGFLS